MLPAPDQTQPYQQACQPDKMPGGESTNPPPQGEPPSLASLNIGPPRSASETKSCLVPQPQPSTPQGHQVHQIGALGFVDPHDAAEKLVSRNVSFIQGSGASTAYKEHNPPTILRQSQPERDESAPEEPVVDGARRVSKTKVKAAPDKTEELHILIGVTGSVATIKVAQIIHKLKQVYHKRAIIQLVATKSSCVFFDPSEIPKDVKIWYDEDEWQSRDGKPDSSVHIQLRRWADILLVAPCSANTLAKLTYGICDNLLTSVFRVWNPAVPILLAPAMNTHMYTNPVTQRHFKALREYFPFVEILKPVEKVLVCGDIGMGGMREWTDIVQTLIRRTGVQPEDEDSDEDP